jgi:hypothetical protein
MLGSEYCPSSPVDALYCEPFVVLVAMTVAPATAPPEAFVTVPNTLPTFGGVAGIPGIPGIWG